jgi:hypothetical protein
VPVGLTVVLLIALAAVIFYIDPIAHALVNRTLNRSLQAGGALNQIDIRLRDGMIEMAGLRLYAPKGFGSDPLLTLGRLRLEIDPMALFDGNLVVEELIVGELSLVLVRDKNGRFSPLYLLPQSGIKSEETEAHAETADQGQTALPPIRVHRIRLEKISVHLIDQQGGEEWKARGSIDLTADDLQINDVLNRDIWLGRLTLAVHDVAIDQPKGFGTAPLLQMDRFTVAASKVDLGSSILPIDRLSVEKLSASVERNGEGVTNLQQLKAALLGKPKAESDAPAPSNPGKGGQEPAKGPPSIRFEKIQVSDGSFTYHDRTISKEGLALPLRRMSLTATHLNLFDKNGAAEPASVTASFQLDQPGQLPTAYFGAEAVVGPIETAPPVNAQVRLVGFKLDTLGSLVPPATRTAIGATGFDASAAMAMDSSAIDLFAAIQTDHNVEYEALRVHGPLEKPKILLADILSGAFDRISDGLINLGGDALGAGVSIAKGGVSVLGDVGKGGWMLGKNLAVSTFGVAKGLVTLDSGEVGKGLQGATKESLAITAGSLKEAGTDAGHSLGDSVSDLTGDDRVRAWDSQIPARYEAVMEQAREFLSKMPYPPAVE